MYAVVRTGGKQYTVKEGEILRVEKLNAEVGEKVVFDEILLVSGDEVKVGNPTVAGAKVEAEVIEQGKAKKVMVFKYKAKKGFHKKNGHRQPFTAVKVTSILA